MIRKVWYETDKNARYENMDKFYKLKAEVKEYSEFNIGSFYLCFKAANDLFYCYCNNNYFVFTPRSFYNYFDVESPIKYCNGWEEKL